MNLFQKKSNLLLTLVALILVLGSVFIFTFFPFPEESSPVFVKTWGAEGTALGEFRGPIGIAGKKGLIIISDTGNSRLQIFNEQGEIIRKITHHKMVRPMHITLHNDKIYVSEYQNDLILIFSLSGELLQTVGKAGDGAGEFDGPAGVAVDPQENLYVADFYNHRVQVLNKSGKFIRQIGKTGKKSFLSGRFNYPTDVEVTEDQKIVVADAYNDRVQIFSKDGDLIDYWGGPLGLNISGSFNGWFKTATGVSIGKNREIYVADFYNDRIQKMTVDGKFLATIKGTNTSALARPTDSYLASDGRLYVVDFGNHQIKIFKTQASNRED